jgi:hypothetical protein
MPNNSGKPTDQKVGGSNPSERANLTVNKPADDERPRIWTVRTDAARNMADPGHSANAGQQLRHVSSSSRAPRPGPRRVLLATGLKCYAKSRESVTMRTPAFLHAFSTIRVSSGS